MRRVITRILETDEKLIPVKTYGKMHILRKIRKATAS